MALNKQHLNMTQGFTNSGFDKEKSPNNMSYSEIYRTPGGGYQD